MNLSVFCGRCLGPEETYELRMPMDETKEFAIVFIHCRKCGNWIYAKKESLLIEPAKWKAAS